MKFGQASDISGEFASDYTKSDIPPYKHDFDGGYSPGGIPKPANNPAMSTENGHVPVVDANPKQLYGDKKVPLHLVPPSAAIYAAIGLREGAFKYGPWNFRDTSVEAMTYIGAIKRHLDCFVDGEDMDPDQVDGLPAKPHLAGAIASLAILIDAYECGYLIDNRPKHGAASRLLKRYEK